MIPVNTVPRFQTSPATWNVLTGDIHQHCAAELWDDTSDPESSLGVELIATSIASDGDGQAGSTSDDWLAHTTTALNPAAFEIPLPDGTLAPGHNTLTATLAEGAWLAWDAVDFFTV